MIREYVLLVGASLLALYVGAVLFAALGTFVCEWLLKCMAKEARDGDA